MRTTMTIDDDVLAAARAIAEREHKSLGEIVSALARRGLQPPARSGPTIRNGIPLIVPAGGSKPVTMELVNRLRDELP